MAFKPNLQADGGAIGRRLFAEAYRFLKISGGDFVQRKCGEKGKGFFLGGDSRRGGNFIKNKEEKKRRRGERGDDFNC